MLDRAPAKQAVRSSLRDLQTNAIGNNIIWQHVNIALDAMDEEVIGKLLPAVPAHCWVVVHKGTTPLCILPTKARARDAIKKLMVGYDGKRRSYTIHKTATWAAK